jgi:hypothetical protein
MVAIFPEVPFYGRDVIFLSVVIIFHVGFKLAGDFSQLWADFRLAGSHRSIRWFLLFVI